MQKLFLWLNIQAYLSIMISLTSSIVRFKSPLFHSPTSRKMAYNNHFSLMVNTPIIIRGVEEIVDKYDIFLLGNYFNFNSKFFSDMIFPPQ